MLYVARAVNRRQVVWLVSSLAPSRWHLVFSATVKSLRLHYSGMLYVARAVNRRQVVWLVSSLAKLVKL